MRRARPVVHLELHTPDGEAAAHLYRQLCNWRAVPARTGSGAYTEVALGTALGGGIVECSTRRALWLPYAEVDDVQKTTDRAVDLGARVLLEPRDGPAGWRSVVRTNAGGELGFWSRR